MFNVLQLVIFCIFVSFGVSRPVKKVNYGNSGYYFLVKNDRKFIRIKLQFFLHKPIISLFTQTDINLLQKITICII